MELKRFALAMVGHFLASLLYVLRRLRLVDAVVDTTSYLEHKEELKDLWEKRMMADANQSPSPSAVTSPSSGNPSGKEEGSDEGVVANCSHSETKAVRDHKLTNGFVVTPAAEVDGGEASNKMAAAEMATETASSDAASIAQDEDNNNSPDSLEVEQKTYTSETTLVIKSSEHIAGEPEPKQTVVDAAEMKKTDVDAAPPEELETKDTSSEDPFVAAVKNEEAPVEEADTKAEDVTPVPSVPAYHPEVEGDLISLSTESMVVVEKEETILTEISASALTTDKQQASDAEKFELVSDTSEDKVVAAAVMEVKKEDHQEPSSLGDMLFPSLDAQKSLDEEDGFVRVEECLPKVDSSDADQESFVVVEEQREDCKLEDSSEALISMTDDSKVSLTNGHSDASLPSTPATSGTPEPDAKLNPDIENFVKSGGLKRVLPGVQQTEGVYSTCTTETKIAMEIREMREREEELRQMREQALLSPVPPKSPVARTPSPCPPKEQAAPSPTPSGYRVSSVFGHVKGAISPQPEDDRTPSKGFKGLSKESAVEKEIRIARDREEELRKQKGLPPREDDSYVKPSQVKSSQVRVFARTASGAMKQAATAKIQAEIEEQTQRELALRDTGSIQTISHERTDGRVLKLKADVPLVNGNGHAVTNGGGYTNGRSSPQDNKRGTPSPTGPRPASIFSQVGSVNMHKFIASKGRETTFSAPRSNGVVSVPREEKGPAVPPAALKLKRTVSVESKIQQEILEMKQREEELKLIHMNGNGRPNVEEDDSNKEFHGVEQRGDLLEYKNGNTVYEDEISPRHNKLIAQWEQRIQKAES